LYRREAVTGGAAAAKIGGFLANAEKISRQKPMKTFHIVFGALQRLPV
jgi:hypothetical protein